MSQEFFTTGKFPKFPKNILTTTIPSSSSHGLVDLLVERLGDEDVVTMKFAAFAVGNAAFHSSVLVPALVSRDAIGALERLLDLEECKVNAAGALCNFAKYEHQVKAKSSWPLVKEILKARINNKKK